MSSTRSGRAWVVRAGDGDTVGAIVERAAPGDTSAIAEGRVFAGRRRVQDPQEPVRVGEEVTVAAREADGGAIAVLAKGRGWIAVDKPAGIPTIPDHGGAAHSLIAGAARAVSLAPEALHATSRLDREVSGVVVFALDKAAAARLQTARDEHRYVRRYVAIASRAPEPAEGAWELPIGRAKDPRHRAVNGRDAVPSKTRYAVAARAGSYCLLALAPITGRTHQLRVHAGHAGAPLLGDRVYGGAPRLTLPNGRVVAFDRVALHCARVSIDVDGAPLTITSPVPEALLSVWVALGGEGDAWEKAASWQLPVG